MSIHLRGERRWGGNFVDLERTSSADVVTPAEVGVQAFLRILDSGFRLNDGKNSHTYLNGYL